LREDWAIEKEIVIAKAQGQVLVQQEPSRPIFCGNNHKPEREYGGVLEANLMMIYMVLWKEAQTTRLWKKSLIWITDKSRGSNQSSNPSSSGKKSSTF